MSELDVINFTNLDTEDFEGMWGGETKVIKAGQTLPFPSFLAHHYAKHLATKILMRENKDWSNESPLLKETIEKILGQIAVSAVATPTEPEKPAEPTFAEAPKEEAKVDFKCDKCDFIGKSRISLLGHSRKHK